MHTCSKGVTVVQSQEPVSGYLEIEQLLFSRFSK